MCWRKNHQEGEQEYFDFTTLLLENRGTDMCPSTTKWGISRKGFWHSVIEENIGFKMVTELCFYHN